MADKPTIILCVNFSFFLSSSETHRFLMARSTQGSSYFHRPRGGGGIQGFDLMFHASFAASLTCFWYTRCRWKFPEKQISLNYVATRCCAGSAGQESYSPGRRGREAGTLTTLSWMTNCCMYFPRTSLEKNPRNSEEHYWSYRVTDCSHVDLKHINIFYFP